MTPDAAVTVTVTCRDGDGNGVRHKVFVAQDGSVSTPDHDHEAWAEDARVLEHLDANYRSPHPCDWWISTPSKPEELIIGWGQGVVYVDGRITLDVTDWDVSVVGEVSRAARRTVFSHFALEGRESDPDMSIEQVTDAVRLLARWAQRDDRLAMTPTNRQQLSVARLQNLMRSTTTQQIVSLLSLGVPWYSIPGLSTLGLTPEDTARAYELMTASEDGGHHLVWFTGMPRPLELALEMGIAKERLVPFLERRAGRGPIMGSEDIRQKIDAAVGDCYGIEPTWIAEAVASLPNHTELIERYGHEVASLHCDGNWQHLLVHDVAADTAILMLQTLGDPAGWPPGWEYPSDDEVEMARVRLTQEVG